MKSLVLTVITGLVLLVSPVCVRADDAPVMVTHTITGPVRGPKSIKLAISVHVTNHGTGPLTNLTLNLVAGPPFERGRSGLHVGNLDPGQSVDLPLQVAAAEFVTVDQVSRRPLFWSGACLDAQGKLQEFKVTSRPGGTL